jgi:hypothetical protein
MLKNDTERVGIIRGAFRRAGWNSERAISRVTGIPYPTLNRNRLKPDMIGNMTLAEFWTMQRHAYFTDEDILRIAKEG